MPELPEVETTKKSLEPLLGTKVNKVELYQPKLRWQVPDDIYNLEGYVLKNIYRRAKYLILEFAQYNDLGNSNNKLVKKTPAKSLLIHLGMSGSLQQFDDGTPKRKHDHLILSCQNYNHSSDIIQKTQSATRQIQLHYHDPRRFGAILWLDDYKHKLLDHLGIEPLQDEFNGDYLYNLIHKIDNTNPNLQNNSSTLQQSNKHSNSKQHVHNSTLKQPKMRSTKPITKAIKSVLMDQKYVVGVGNIYATESLFLSGIHPNTPANILTQDQLNKLTDHVKAILKRAIEQGSSTLRDFTVANGTTGYFQQTLLVYGQHKQPCPTCATPIEKVSINGRASTYCPICQPFPSL